MLRFESWRTHRNKDGGTVAQEKDAVYRHAQAKRVAPLQQMFQGGGWGCEVLQLNVAHRKARKDARPTPPTGCSVAANGSWAPER